MLNNITLMGRLTRDPELRHTQNGTPVTSYTLAVERDFGDNGDKVTDFIDIVAWQKSAEFANTYFYKGQLIAVKGRLQTRKWIDRDGNNRTAFEVVVDHQYFAESKPKSETPYQAPLTYGNTPAPQKTRATAPMFEPSAFEDLPDDGELPF